MSALRSQVLGGSTGIASELQAQLWREGFTVGTWSVEPRRHRLTRDETERRLDPRLMSVLVTLAVASGEVVTRQELLDAVWKETFVSENSLSKAISRLRKTLNGNTDDSPYIETISKSGYRLIATVGPPRGDLPLSAGNELSAASATPISPSLPAAEAARRRRDIRRFWLPLATGALMLAAAMLLTWSDLASRPAAITPPVPHIRPELTLAGSQFGPRLSPDGESVAFAWNGGDSSADWDIWTQRIGADHPLQLTDDPSDERLPTFSPDGERLAFVRFSASDGTCGIFSLDRKGTSLERLADCAEGMRSLAWSPDGRWLAHNGLVDAEGGPRALFLLELETGQRRQLSHPPAGIIGDTNPRFSPDGMMVSFEREIGEHRHDIAVIPVAGGETQILTSDRWGQVRGLDWSSDGASVIFSSNRSGKFALWKVSVSGGAPEPVPIYDAWVTQPDVSRAGGRLIYRTFRDSVDVWELPLHDQPGEAIRRVPSSRSESQAVWSANADAIAFISDRSGTTELWSGAPDGADLVRHSDLQGPLPALPTWSPDGRNILFDAAVHGHADLWLVERQSRQPRRLTDEVSEERNGSFSRDGRHIYFASDRGGGWNIWRMPATGGRAEQITSGGGFLAQESRDGRLLFYVRLDQPGLWSMAVEGGPAVERLSDLSLSDWASWALGDRGLYYLRRGPTSIVFAPFDGSPSKVLHTPTQQMPYLGRALALSSDGQALLFSQIDHSDDEVMTVDMPGL